MSLAFNLLKTAETGGRRAQMHLPHQTVETPVFMPVGTAGSVKAVPQDIVESLGAQIILGNTYHLYLRPGHEAIRRMGGLHRFISWPRGMLTDSGGFQVFSLTQLRKVTDEGVRLRLCISTAAVTSLRRSTRRMCRSRWARISAWHSTSARSIPQIEPALKRACD